MTYTTARTLLILLFVIIAILVFKEPHSQTSAVIFANGFENPSACPAPIYTSRQPNTPTKFGTKPGNYLLSTADEVFNDDPKTPTEPFPWVGNRSVTMAVNSQKYLALRFDVPMNLSASFAGQFGFFDTNYAGSPSFPLFNGSIYSVSKCPGDFSDALPAVCKGQWNGADGNYVIIASPEREPHSTLCRLERGKTYYLNLVNGTLLTPAVSTCGSAVNSCAASISYFRN